MAVVVNGILMLDGIAIGKVEGIKEGTTIDLEYKREVKVCTL